MPIKLVALPRISGNGELANIWKFYFNSVFFLSLGPFKIIKTEKVYYVKQRRIWRLFSGLVCLIIIIFNYNYIIQDTLQGKILSEVICDKSGFFFHVSVGFVRLALTSVTMHELWFRERNVVNIINFLGDPRSCIPRVSAQVILKVKMLMVASFFTLCVVEFIIEHFRIYKEAGQFGYWYSLCLFADKYHFLDKESCFEPGSANVATLPGKFAGGFSLISKCLW